MVFQVLICLSEIEPEDFWGGWLVHFHISYANQGIYSSQHYVMYNNLLDMFVVITVPNNERIERLCVLKYLH